MEGLLGVIIVIPLLLLGLFYLIRYLISSAVKKGALEALIEYDKMKNIKNNDK